MKGPKDSKESHTSVTMEGMARAGCGEGDAAFCLRVGARG